MVERKTWMPACAGMTGFWTLPQPQEQKFFAEFRVPMTERQRGLNRAAQLWFKKATSFFIVIASAAKQ
jgi:hypothetical protein